MKRLIVYFASMLVFIFLQSCSSDTENIRKEGCINKNTLRIVVYFTESTLPAGKLNKNAISNETLKIAMKRCQTIISNALAINKKQYSQPDSHSIAWKIVLIEKKNNGYIGIVDYTLDDETASLLQCR